MYNNMFKATKEAETIGYVSSKLTNATDKYSYNEESLASALYKQKNKIIGGLSAGGIGGVLAYNHVAIKSLFNKMVENVDVMIKAAQQQGDELMTNVFSYMSALKEKGLSNIAIFNNTVKEFRKDIGDIFTRFTEYLPWTKTIDVSGV